MRERASARHVKLTMRQLVKVGAKQLSPDELASIAVPTDLLWGRHDRAVPLRLGAAASARFGWPLHVVDGVGHAPHIERPDAFLAALAEIESAACATLSRCAARVDRPGGGPATSRCPRRT